MSDLESLCRTLEDSVQPLPGLAGGLDQRAARLRSTAAEVERAARQVEGAPNVSGVIRTLHEAAAALDASGRSLITATQQSRNYVARTIGLGDGGGVAVDVSDDAGTAGFSGSGAGGGQGLPDGWAIVPLSAIDDADSGITGPESFDSGHSPDDLAWGLTAMRDVVLPAISRGAGVDYFRELDQAEGNTGDRTYDRTYHGFFGDSHAIKLFPRGAGAYGVRNGYHRIWLAKQMGMESIPARIR